MLCLFSVNLLTACSRGMPLLVCSVLNSWITYIKLPLQLNLAGLCVVVYTTRMNVQNTSIGQINTHCIQRNWIFTTDPWICMVHKMIRPQTLTFRNPSRVLSLDGGEESRIEINRHKHFYVCLETYLLVLVYICVCLCTWHYYVSWVIQLQVDSSR